jgi:predicted nuclease with TOPRIM domain
MTPQHAGLLRRVSALMRPTMSDPEAEPEPEEAPPEADLEALQERIARLEVVVEGLQDALYRHSQKLDERVEELKAKIEPEALARELSADARRRGL